MKQTILILLCFVATLAKAQTFEGTLTWAIKMDITDPATKAQMENAQKQLSDPATQAKMKELEAKMQDPQFKAMMEQNPQMKAQLESMLKAAQGGNITSMVPTGLVVKIKGLNTITRMEGGMMGNTELLYLGDKQTTYRLDRQGRTYSAMKTYEPDPEKKTDYKVTKTNETAKVLGYTCTKYIVDYVGKDQQTKDLAMQQIMWVTKDIAGIDVKQFAKQRLTNSKQGWFYEDIDGMPLKVELKMKQGNMLMEASQIKRESLPASDFAIPADYKEVQSQF